MGGREEWRKGGVSSMSSGHEEEHLHGHDLSYGSVKMGANISPPMFYPNHVVPTHPVSINLETEEGVGIILGTPQLATCSIANCNFPGRTWNVRHNIVMEDGMVWVDPQGRHRPDRNERRAGHPQQPGCILGKDIENSRVRSAIFSR